MNIRENATIYRDNNTIKATTEQIEDNKEILFKIRKNIINNKDVKFEYINNQYQLDENKNLNKNCSWFLLKPSKIGAKMNKYKLTSGDIIKIGRISLRIRDIHFSQNNSNNNIKNDIFTNIDKAEFNLKDLNTLRTEANINNGSRNYLIKKINFMSHTKSKGGKQISLTKNLLNKIEKKNKICRICYMEESDPEDNPLLQPCLCTGSLKYIHLSCLKHWISTRSCEKIDTTAFSIVYIIKQVECELCKAKFPDLIEHNNKIHHLLDFSKDFESYLTLESLTLDKYKNKFIYVISLMNSNKKMKLGRGHECEILLSDISVSRVHCFLLADSANKNLYIIDNDSKFGTLILYQAPFIKLEELLPLNIQIGRTYVKCLVKRPFKFFQCCNVEEYSNIFYYFEQNKVKKNINLIVKSDSMDDKMNNKFVVENYTCEQKYPNKINGELTYDKLETVDINKDKISDNEYLRMRHKAENKNNIGNDLVENDKKDNDEVRNGMEIKANDNDKEDESVKIENNDDEGNSEEENIEENNDNNNNDNAQEEEFNENDATVQ